MHRHLQCSPRAMVHNDFSSYWCPMRYLLFQDFMYSAVPSIVNIVIFVAYFSTCAVYFDMCRQHCTWYSVNSQSLTRVWLGLSWFIIMAWARVIPFKTYGRAWVAKKLCNMLRGPLMVALTSSVNFYSRQADSKKVQSAKVGKGDSLYIAWCTYQQVVVRPV